MNSDIDETQSEIIELYRLLDEGEEAVRQGRKSPLDEAMSEIRNSLYRQIGQGTKCQSQERMNRL